MRKSKRVLSSTGAWGALIALGAVAVVLGCEAPPTTTGGREPLGTLQLPLISTTPAGTTYRLSNATFVIVNGSVGVSILVSGDDPTLTVELPPSLFSFDYQVSLQDGWTLSVVEPGGTERPISATLLNNFQAFTIRSQRTTPVTFQFKAGSSVVTFGDGALSISILVDDTTIDDFEDGDGLIVPIGGRSGAWFTFNDGTGTQTPPPGAPIVPEVLAADASYVLHETGTGFAPVGELPDGSFAFGAGLGVHLRHDDATGLPLPYDASGYEGIGFSFRYAFPSAVSFFQILGFYVATSATTPVAEGGTCTASCYDDYSFVGDISFSPLLLLGLLPLGGPDPAGLRDAGAVRSRDDPLVQVDRAVPEQRPAQLGEHVRLPARQPGVRAVTAAHQLPHGGDRHGPRHLDAHDALGTREKRKRQDATNARVSDSTDRLLAFLAFLALDRTPSRDQTDCRATS